MAQLDPDHLPADTVQSWSRWDTAESCCHQLRQQWGKAETRCCHQVHPAEEKMLGKELGKENSGVKRFG